MTMVFCDNIGKFTVNNVQSADFMNDKWCVLFYDGTEEIYENVQLDHVEE